ncbi:MAG TPA: phosphatase PAP2 family protein [Elusimicrobiales bacterium]|nr:phosphatase PAP2 family protein [Elusimicrobiales bacterium]
MFIKKIYFLKCLPLRNKAKPFLRGLLISVFLNFTVYPAFAGADEDVYKLPTPTYAKRFWGDLKELPVKPFHWSTKQWLLAGGILGASFSAFIIDDSIRQHYRDHRSGLLTDVSTFTTHFGDYKMQMPIILSIWTLAVATNSSKLHKMAGDAAEASVIAAGLITPLLVMISGRDLPSADEHAMKFEPFTSDRYAYPSGHTTAAFALATVLDQNLRDTFGYWQTPLLYAIAAGTAHSRIYDHTHYLSDVILGAGIGWAVGYWISNKPRGETKTTLIFPTPNGIALAYRF